MGLGFAGSEHPRVRDWGNKTVGAAWQAFDLQLVTYALLLASIGVAMAYSNSVGSAQNVLDAGTTFVRGLLWTGVAIVVFIVVIVFDYQWLKTLAWPIYLVQIGLLVMTLAIGTGVGGVARWILIGGVAFQFSELAKILMIVEIGRAHV